MSLDESITLWIREAKSGEAKAAQQLWQRYFERLMYLARKKLGDAPRRVADEEDVVLSAFHSFFEGARKGRFPELRDRDDLWPLLVKITARKAIDQVHHQKRLKRGGGRVRGESALQGPGDADERRAIEQVIGNEPSPEFALLVVEQVDRLVETLGDESLRRVARLKLDGATNEEIAKTLGCKDRTVRRKLELIRGSWLVEGVLDV